MKRTHVIVLVATGLLAAAWIFARAMREPRHQGRSVQSWVEDFRLVGGEGHERAVKAMCTMGTNAIPGLLKLLRSQDSGFKSTLEGILPRRLVPQSLPASVNHWRAETGLHALGGVAVPALLPLLGDTNIGTRVGDVLIGIGEKGVPELQQALTNGNRSMKFNAATVLGWLSGEAKAAVPALLLTLKGDDEPLRKAAASALYRIDSDAAERAGVKFKSMSRHGVPPRWETDVVMPARATASPPPTVRESP